MEAELDGDVQGVGVALDDTVQGAGAGMFETSEDEGEGAAQQGGSGNPSANPRQNLTSKDRGVRKRVASDTSSSTSSNKSDNSIKANHKNTDAKVVTSKRRRQSGRQDNVLERHRHHSVHEVYYGQGTLQARDQARDAGVYYGQGTGQGTQQPREGGRGRI